MDRAATFSILFSYFFILNTQAQTAQFPAQSCSALWTHAKPGDSRYDSSRDSDYRSFIARMKSENLLRQECLKTWTILISMSVSNDLKKYAIKNLKQLEKQTKGAHLRTDIIVQLEDQSSQTVRRYHLFQPQSAQPFHEVVQDLENLSLDEIQSPIISESKTVDFKQKNRFSSFIRWGAKSYPSENLMLIFWGHGRGWQTLSELGVANTLAKVRKWRGRPLEILAWDACYMQSLENVVEVAPWTRFVCGSEDVESYEGYDYASLIQSVIQPESEGDYPPHSGIPPESVLDIASSIPETYQAAFNSSTDSKKQIDPSITENLTGSTVQSHFVIKRLVPSLNQLAIALKDFTHIPAHWDAVRSLIKSRSTYRGGTRDLGIFLEDLLETVQRIDSGPHATDNSKLLDLILSTCGALNEAVIRRALGHGYRSPHPDQICKPAGLSIFLPQTKSEFHEQLNLVNRASLYQGDHFFSIQSSWADWVKSMY